MEDNKLFYGANGQPIQKGDQVGFAITKTTVGEKGDIGTGVIEFNKPSHTIYVDGTKFGGVDTDGNDIKSTYVTKTGLDSSLKSLDGSIQSRLDASIGVLTDSVATNFSNLRIFKTINGIEAASNSDSLTFSVGDGVKITTTGKDIKFESQVATDSSFGAIKSGGDISVGTDGVVTVNKVTTANPGILVNTATGTSTLEKLTVNTDGSILYNSKEIATKEDIETIQGEIADGMHYKKGIASLSEVEATKVKGDFYVSTAEFTIEGVGKVESGDYIIWNGSSWDVVNRNITETDTIASGTTNDALIPTAKAVKDYVEGIESTSVKFTTLNGVDAKSSTGKFAVVGGTALSASVTSNDTSVIVTVNHDNITRTNIGASDEGNATVTITKNDSTAEVITVVTSNEQGHVTGTTAKTISFSGVFNEIDSVNTVAEAAAHTVDQNVLTTDGSVYVLGGAGGDKSETSYVQNVSFNKDGKLAVKSLEVDGVALDATNLVQSATTTDSATPTATIKNGQLTVGGVSAIAVDGTASTTNTYNAQVLQQSIFWFVEE